MILWLTIGIGIVALIAGCIIDKINMDWGTHDMLIGIVAAILVMAIVAACIMCIAIIIEHTDLDACVAANQARYESLVFQLEHNIYDNDNGVGKYELYRDIREWNEDLSGYKARQRDFWVGVFTPNIYDQFEFIDITEGN